MANINDRPNLKICIDNIEEGSESDSEVRVEEDAGDVIVTGDVESEAGESYTESGGKVDKSESSAAEEDEEIERAILEANIPPEELRELSPEPQPVPVSISYLCPMKKMSTYEFNGIQNEWRGGGGGGFLF